jgi:diguanylate cyclase (GGDEF)-like protein
MSTTPQQDRPTETISVAAPKGAMQVIFSKNPMTIVWLLFILCLSLTLRIWVLAKNTAEENAQVLFSLYTQQVESRLQERIKSYEQFLRNQGALWESPLFLVSDWQDYVSHTDLFSKFPDIEFIGFAELESNIPFQWNKHPKANVKMISPETLKTRALLGQDFLKQLHNPPNQISGIFLRTDNRNTTAWLNNIADRSFDIVIPLEKKGIPKGGLTRRALVFGSINISSLINSVTENQLFRTSLRLYQSSSPLITSSDRIVYETEQFNASAKARSSRLIFPILDRFWIIDFMFPTELAAQSKIVNTLIWISGLLFSLIIFGINKSIVDYNRFILLRRAHEDLKANELRLKYDASHDLLTGLYNRQALAERFSEAMRYASENQREIAIVFIDIDNLKDINDRLGHNYGDELLKFFARKLTNSIRSMDTAARVGGDEFVLILSHLKNSTEITTLVQRILHAVSTPITFNDTRFNTSCSIGISVYPHDGDTLEILTKQADSAMYQSKKMGKNSFTFYQKIS